MISPGRFRDGLVPDAIRAKYLDGVIQGLNHMSRTVSDAMELAKLEAEQTAPELPEIPREPILVDVSRRWSHRFAESQVRYSVDIQMDTVRAKPDLLQRALDRLLENALRFTPAGGNCLGHGNSGR